MRSRAIGRSTLPLGFRRLVWSNLIAQTAEQIGLAATPLAAVFVLNSSAAENGYLQTAQTLPFLCLSLPFGVLADRFSRRKLMALAEMTRACMLATILVCLAAHTISLFSLGLFSFLAAAGTVAYNVSAPSLVASIVSRDALPMANGRTELVRSVAYSAGPALGGLLGGWIGPVWAFGAAALLSASAAGLLSRMDEPQRPTGKHRNVRKDLVEGAQFVIAEPLLRSIMVTAFFFNIGLFSIYAVYVPYAARWLQMNPSQIGATMAMYGIGMIIGALFARVITRKTSFGMSMGIGPLFAWVASIVMLMTILFPSFWIACLCFFLLGSGPILWVISSTTLRQVVTPPLLLGRVSSLIALATYGSRPIGTMIGATVAQFYSQRGSLVVAFVAFSIQAVVIFRSPVVRLRDVPEAASVGI
ncbi:MFS transporter [Robbsia andropogonis]|uniref:MFS transporter n=1 Tax=Robbsia andropogonis TaxID=28092 RepID=UPI002A6B1D91|nr:MFS transporter [Robbsia andropogonis]